MNNKNNIKTDNNIFNNNNKLNRKINNNNKNNVLYKQKQFDKENLKIIHNMLNNMNY